MIKILLVEDQSGIRDVTSQLLEFRSSDKIEVIQAANGVEALRMMDSSIQLILMDIRMPKMDGLTAIKEIKAVWSDTPIWCLSAYSNKRDEAIQAGAERFYIKPINHQHLVGQILERVKERPDDDTIEKIKIEIRLHKNRLQILRNKQAQAGFEASTALIMEIEEIENTIERLQEQING